MQNTQTRFLNLTSKTKKYIIVAVLVIAVLIIGIKLISRPHASSKSNTVLGASTPQKSETLNKEFTFPVTNVNGDPISIKFAVQDASLNNQIVVQGQVATAVTGRQFLIVTLALSNSFNQSININTRDYVRLSVNKDENTWLAPDIHNDPVEVQAISTKYTRVGFAINTSDKNFVLQIGEIKGDKQKISLNL